VSINGCNFSILNIYVNPLGEKKFIWLNAVMDIQQILKRFPSQRAMAQAFGVTEGAVSQWIAAGRLPDARVWQWKAGLAKPVKRR
jgi:hypothetical protein